MPQPKPSPRAHKRPRVQPIVDTLRTVDEVAIRNDEDQNQFLAVCQQIYERHRGMGNGRPFEEFFSYIVLMAERYRFAVTPDHVAKRLEEFRDDFEQVKVNSAHFIETYGALPEEVKHA